MKLEWLLLGVLVEEDSRPSKQARAAKRFILFVSDLIEREVADDDLDTMVPREGIRVRVGESGSGGSVMRKDWPADRETMDKWGKESTVVGETAVLLSRVDLRTLLRMRTDTGFPAAVGSVTRLDEIEHSTLRG